MVRRSAARTAALGLVLRLLLGLGLGMEAAPTSGTTQSPVQASSPSTGFCPPTRFQCRTSGFCVPLSWRCDGDQDCPDGSDEECKVEPCAQDGQCPPPTGSPCSCDNIDDCPDDIKKNLPNCSSQPCQKGEFRCPLDGTCVPHTWLCDGHPDCPDSSDELGCGTETLQEVTSVGTSVTQESVTYLRNATTTLIRDQDSVHSGNQNADGVITAAVVLSASLVAATLLVLFWLCARGLLCTLGLPVAVKESLAALRTCSCHHIAQAMSVEAIGTGTLLLAQQPSDVDSCSHAALQT